MQEAHGETTFPEAWGLGQSRPGVCAGGRWRGGGEEVASLSPADASELGRLTWATVEDTDAAIRSARETFLRWRELPAPRRGQLVRAIGDALRRRREELGRLVALESGKILPEALGEVQEMIDIADYAVGLSRSFGGPVLPSERPGHRMYEQWHPLGPIGVITAFNFPVAVWSWNAFVAAVCGDTVVWKPSEKTPLCAAAVQRTVLEVLEPAGWAGVFQLVNGGADVGGQLAADPRLPLVSATGSCRMGRAVAATVASRMGRQLLELGGNNAVVVLDDADLDLALRAVTFGALGTAGQRCTTTRRLILEKGIAREFTQKLLGVWPTARIGHPLEPDTLVGPLIDESAVELFVRAVERARSEGGEVLCGGRRLERPGFYVEPALVRVRPDLPLVEEETFAPVLWITEVEDLDEAIARNNAVSQGLSSAIFTESMRSAERFLAATGSDCGIANVNIGTSGAEIGGAFGGEKDTGGGREAGSDAWKAYMRRQTCTINWSGEMPLAQGIRFGE